MKKRIILISIIIGLYANGTAYTVNATVSNLTESVPENISENITVTNSMFTVDETGYVIKVKDNGSNTVIVPNKINNIKIKGISVNAFKDTKYLTVITAQGITDINSEAFKDSNVKSIYVKGTLDNVVDDVVVYYPTDKAYSGNNGIPYGYSQLDISETGIIQKYTGTETNIVIPNTMYGIVVTDIGESAFESSNITDITIPEGIEIGKNCFKNCSKLKSVNSGNKEELVLENNTVNGTAFEGCDKLTSAYITESNIKDGGLANMNISEAVLEDCKIGVGVFAHCESLTSVDLGDTAELPESTFKGCYSLTDIDLTNINEIGDQAFYMCEHLTDITLPNVKTIGKNAFYECIALKNITFGDKLTEINDYAFYHCVKLTDTVLSNKLKYIGDYAFSGCGMLRLPESISLPNVTYVGEGAFYECRDLTVIRFGDKLIEIGNIAFA